uniref:C-type lectin domain-containing protein n=1 Tax=Amphiprion ocellaris TaxID=80972 RepID=A0A3Q1CQ35_AMPOC
MFCVFLTGWLILPTCSLRQYYFIKEPLTWNEAQTYCRQKYTDLATMESATVMNQLQRLLSSSGHNSGVWFGLYSKINWKWSDGFTGSGAEYRDWGTNEPQSQINHFCVVKDEKWYIRDCGSVLPFICYNENPQFVPVTKAMNWSDAQKYCRENYVDLATVTNATKDQQVKLHQPQSQPAWIGLFRDPELYFSDGSSLSWSYFDHFKFPIGSNTVLCGTTALSRSMIWRLWYCERKKSFLCHGDPGGCFTDHQLFTFMCFMSLKQLQVFLVSFCVSKQSEGSATVMNQLQRLLSSSGHNSGVWFGLYSKINWKWSDGFTGSGAEYREWSTNEPQFQMDRFCVYVHKHWVSFTCGSELPFVCYKGKGINIKIIHFNLN